MLAAVASAMLSSGVHAQNFPITPAQKATAAQVAQTGVDVSELAPNAPESYTVKRGDTLWAISGMFLKSPWKWPELWGMNLDDIANPHRIYPGQQLFLDTKDGRAMLRTRMAGGANGDPATVKVTPQTRYEALADTALPTLSPAAIEPFLSEPIIVAENELLAAPKIVSAQEGRVLLSRGDKAYVAGPVGAPLVDAGGKAQQYRVFRTARPVKDPTTDEILGYEAAYVGQVELTRGETVREETLKGEKLTETVPGTVVVVRTKEEMRAGDRLLPEPPRQLVSYVPRAPTSEVQAQVVSVYGSAVANAAQNQIVLINRGSRDGMQSGYILALQKDGRRFVDKDDPAKRSYKLPDERNGLLMVFRVFDRVSYGLVLQIADGVTVGDRLVNPR